MEKLPGFIYYHVLTRQFFILLIIAGFMTNAVAWRDLDMEVKLTDLNKSQLVQLKTLNLKGDVWSTGTTAKATLYITPDELTALELSGLQYTITIPCMKEYYKKFWTNQKYAHHSSQSYDDADRIIAIIDSLVNANPAICAKISLGKSVNGNELCMLKISDNVSKHENEAQVCFDAGIHGDEVGGPQNLILFAKKLCSEYTTNATVTELVNSREIFLYCMVNPDGRDNMTRENANNVDCNRDGAFMWGAEGGSISPCSQLETKALRNAILSNKFTVHVSYHSGIEEILYPWGYSSTDNPDVISLKSITSVYAENSGYSSLPVLSSNADYPTHGETLDYTYGTMGTASMTMEISAEKQPADIAGYFNKNVDAMLKIIEYAGYGINGTVSDTNDAAPIAAVLYVDSSYPVYSDSAAGDFHKFVKAGTHSIIVTANGYKSKTLSNITVQDGNATTLAVHLERDTVPGKCYGYKVVSTDSSTGIPWQVLNQPDGKSCSLQGTQGIIIDMQYPIADNTGKDIIVHVSSSSTYTCYCAQLVDGPWKTLGTSAATDSFDISGLLTSCRYIKIQSSKGNLDAVEGKWAYSQSTNTTGRIAVKSDVNPLVVSQVDDRLKIQMSVGATAEVSIYTVMGRCCVSSLVKNGQFLWQIPGNGVYIVKVKNMGRLIAQQSVTCE